MNKRIKKNLNPFLEGGGELGEIMRQKNWGATALGTPDNWPLPLRNTISLLLNSQFPILLYWGADLRFFYNDAFRPSLGMEGKHPKILGMQGKDAWPEIWSTIEPLLHGVLNTGNATWHENMMLPVYRNGKVEDAYWTFSYSPIKDEANKNVGVLTICTETTENMANLKKLEESNDELEFAIDAADLGTWDYNPKTGKFKGNTRLKKWFGLPLADEIALAQAVEAIVEPDRERVQRLIEEALDSYESGGKYDVIYTIRNKKTGQEKIVRALGRAWFGDDKTAYRFNGTLQDITTEYKANKKQAEQELELQEKKDFLEIAVDVADMATYAIYPSTNTAIGDDRLGEWHGLPKNKMFDFALGLQSVFHEDRQRFQNALEEAFDIKNGKLDIEYRIVNPSTGVKRFVHAKGKTIFDDGDKPLRLIGVLHDISEEKKNIIKLQEREERFRQLVKDVDVGIAIFEVNNYKVTLANDTALRIWDKTFSEALYRPFFEVMPEIEKGLAPLFQNVVDTEKTQVGLEYPLVLNRSGVTETGYFNFSFRPGFDEHGSVSEIICVAFEVTEMVKARFELEESEKQFKKFVQQSPIAMGILKGKTLTIEMANDALLNVFWHKKRKSVIGKRLLDIFPNLVDSKYPDVLRGVMKTGNPVSEKESYVKLEDSKGFREYYVDYEYAPLKEIDGAISGVMLTSTDVTDRVMARKKLEHFSNELEKQVRDRTVSLKTANEKLRAFVQELKKSNDELESFAYVSSHDLQEPLRKIQMFAGRIQHQEEQNLSEDGKLYFSKISNAAERMRTLIQDLLAFSRAAKGESEFVQRDLKEILEEVIESLSEKIENAGAEIVYTDLCEVKVVPFQIRQVFQNLIENSIKFSKKNEKPIIVITTASVSGTEANIESLDAKRRYCELTFSDNGIGFAPENGAKIFEIFQRLHGKFDYQGTGIGLAIVKKIALNHKGAITATGTSGKGATFKLYLPFD